MRSAAGGRHVLRKLEALVIECNFELHAHDNLLDLRNLSQSSYC